jgi:general secretion pathway protein L
LHRFGAAALDAWLAECGLRRDQVIVGPVVGRDLFLQRDLSVPKAALGALPKILEQEVLRRTPFQLSDIWHAALPSAGAGRDAQAMCHWIIRKDRAKAALAELGLDADEIDFLAASDANGAVVPVIFLRAVGNEDPPWARRAVNMLAVTGLCAVMLGLVAFEWCQASVATGIEASLLEAREGAQGGQGGLNEATRLFAMKADVSILEIWDELSRVLPDDTFLSETRIAEDKVMMAGFSSDAARLVGIIDRSPLFSSASLISAITPDATEQKDRFSISFKVRDGRTARSSGSTRSPTS